MNFLSGSFNYRPRVYFGLLLAASTLVLGLQVQRWFSLPTDDRRGFPWWQILFVLIQGVLYVRLLRRRQELPADPSWTSGDTPPP